jgi:hypothetical protein
MPAPRQIDPSAAVLWASAFVIAALTIVQAGRLPGPAARAAMVSRHGDYTMLTARSGRGPDEKPYELLYVIDTRDQVLLVYDVEEPQRGVVTPVDGGPLENLFRGARR